VPAAGAARVLAAAEAVVARRSLAPVVVGVVALPGVVRGLASVLLRGEARGLGDVMVLGLMSVPLREVERLVLLPLRDPAERFVLLVLRGVVLVRLRGVEPVEKGCYRGE